MPHLIQLVPPLFHAPSPQAPRVCHCGTVCIMCVPGVLNNSVILYKPGKLMLQQPWWLNYYQRSGVCVLVPYSYEKLIIELMMLWNWLIEDSSPMSSYCGSPLSLWNSTNNQQINQQLKLTCSPIIGCYNKITHFLTVWIQPKNSKGIVPLWLSLNHMGIEVCLP